MAGYKYRGDVFDAHWGMNWNDPLPKPEPEITSTCGTVAGYRRHQNKYTPICDECKAAAKAYQRQRYLYRRAA